MFFTSSVFIFFLIVVFALYYSAGSRQWQVLLAASVFFYAFAGVHYLLYLAATITTVYVAARKVEGLRGEQAAMLERAARSEGIGKKSEKKAIKENIKTRQRRLIILCLLINLGILAVVKYSAFAVSNINAIINVSGPETDAFFTFALPLGISFYTFQSIGYLIDVYRGKPAERNPFRFALFVSFFPQMIQGPISRFGDLSETLFASHKFGPEVFAAGMRRVLWGFFKKLVIADRMLIAVRVLSTDTDTYGGAFVLVNMFFYAITLYADFSGGIDITIGIAQAMGIRVKENFNRPFYSKSIAEYWRRWHITMGTWFKDYLFYPLSVSQPMLKFSKFSRQKFGSGFGKRLPVYISTIILWFTTGLWHGASWNFIVWGLANGIVIILSEEFAPLYRRFHNRFSFGQTRAYGAFQIFRTFWLMAFIRTFNLYRDVPLTFAMYGSILMDFDLGAALNFAGLGLTLADYVIAGIGCGIMILAGVVMQRESGWLDKRPIRNCIVCSALLIATLVFGIYGVGFDVNQFIYNQF
jgi:D-alanyl-lipoteichoic acid acyltransferase DltB (MBOAT superfamily)